MERKADTIASAVAICNKVPHPPQKRRAKEASKEQAKKERKQVEKGRKLAEIAAAEEVGRQWLAMEKFSQKVTCAK